MIGPVSIPAADDQPQFVTQVASNRVDVDEFNRWAARLGDSIAQVVTEDLAVLLGTPDVATAPMANFNAAYTVTIDVQQFESTQGKGVVLEAVWAVHQTAGGAKRSGRTRYRLAASLTAFGLAAVLLVPIAALGLNLAGQWPAIDDRITSLISHRLAGPPPWLGGLPLVGSYASNYWHSAAGKPDQLR